MGIQTLSSVVGYQKVALLDNKVLDSTPLELGRAVTVRSITVTFMIWYVFKSCDEWLHVKFNHVK